MTAILTGSPTRYGRYQVAEPHSALMRTHLHRGEELREVDHEPHLAVLDQEDLHAQGIYCSQFIPGAGNPDALGSCTAQASTVALSNVLPETDFYKTIGVRSYDDAVAAEKWAIGFYHQCTDQTGNTATEWPPTDCGSSGPYIVQELRALGLVSGDRIAHGAPNLVSLLQGDGVLMGSPWLNAWEQPDSDGFIDGDGTVDALEAAIRTGVAGGHETYLCAVERLTVTATGQVDPFRTVLRGRNSWSRSWGDNGDYRLHLSTLAMLGQYCDFRQLVA
ncbi:MAG: hypothetical protein ACRDRL_12300 [Sciscionella sp.]